VPAAAQSIEDLCARLSVPEGAGLGCTVRSDPATAGLAAVVQPTDSDFAPLSELTLERVEEPVDDPGAWLREQLTLDLSPVDAALDELIRGADSPITGTPLAERAGDHYAIRIRTMNEQRLRHLVAIANSF
jgi:hypothetical protein